MRSAVAELRAEAEKAGRNPQDITISFRGPLDVSEASGADRRPLSGSIAAIQDDIGRYAECGVSHMVFDIMAPEVTALQDSMSRFVQDIQPLTHG